MKMNNFIAGLHDNYIMLMCTVFAGIIIRIFYECKNFKSSTKEEFYQFLNKQILKVLCAIVVLVIVGIIMKMIL